MLRFLVLYPFFFRVGGVGQRGNKADVVWRLISPSHHHTPFPHAVAYCYSSSSRLFFDLYGT